MALTRTETTQADWQQGTLSGVMATSVGDLILNKNKTTFLYDDFSADLSKWTVEADATPSIVSGQLKITAPARTSRGVLSKKMFYGDGWIQADIKPVSGEIWIEMTNTIETLYFRGGFSDGSVWLQGLGVNISKPYSYSPGTYYTVKIEKTSGTIKLYVNNVLQLSGTANTSLDNWVVRLYGWNKSAATEVWFDNVYVNGDVYVSSGYRISPALDLSSVGMAASSQISWTATTPSGTSVDVETSLDGGTTWQQATNGGAIPGITPGMNLSGKSLLVRQILTTSDPTETPILSDLMVTIGSLQTATATAQGGATDTAHATWIGSVGAAAQSSGAMTGRAALVASAAASASAVLGMDWNERIQAVRATAMAGATLDVAAIRILIQTLMVNAVIQPGDIVEIDTAKMTVKINGVNALQFMEGDFFTLLPGTNHLEYQDSEQSREVQIITRHRPRWL